MLKNIVLVGMPGCGKTTIGSYLAKKLNMKFIDMDEYIVAKEQKSIDEMFSISEDCFRNAETNAAKELSEKNNHVIATGGGIIKREENINYLKRNSIIFFINRPLNNIISDINISTRPLLKKNIDHIYNLYNERIHLYKLYCHIEINNNMTIEDSVNDIITLSK